MLPAVSEHVRLGSTPTQSASSCPALPGVLHSTPHSLLAYALFMRGWTDSQAWAVAHGLPGNEPFGKHAFWPPGSRHEYPVGHAPATHAKTQRLPPVSEHVRRGSTPAHRPSSCAGLPGELQSTAHLLLTHTWFTPGPSAL